MEGDEEEVAKGEARDEPVVAEDERAKEEELHIDFEKLRELKDLCLMRSVSQVVTFLRDPSVPPLLNANDPSDSKLLTPLHAGILSLSLPLVRLLVAHGARASVREGRGNNAFHLLSDLSIQPHLDRLSSESHLLLDFLETLSSIDLSETHAALRETNNALQTPLHVSLSSASVVSLPFVHALLHLGSDPLQPNAEVPFSPLSPLLSCTNTMNVRDD